MKKKSSRRTLFAAVALAAVAAGATLPMAANARSLIHYFDFDATSGDGLAYTDVDKGSSPANLTLKEYGTEYAPRTIGALGSDHAFCSSSGTSLWLGDGSTSLGCGTVKGFTISFWCKLSSSHKAWSDFFGFRVGGKSYRFEYCDKSGSQFAVFWGNPNLLIDSETGDGFYYAGATPGDWHHVAVVATPNGTNSLGTCALFVNGGKVGNIALQASGDLQELNVGTWQRNQNDSDRKNDGNNTCIDELAVFDYPATAEQVKWLAKYKPAQPVNGPARAMPIVWLFDTTNSTQGVLAGDNGSGTHSAELWKGNDPKATAVANGALGSAYCMEVNNKATWRVADSSSIGATVGSGYTISFWLKAPSNPKEWGDFFYYGVGGMPSSGENGEARGTRFEFDKTVPAKIGAFGYGLTDTYCERGSETVDTWQHVCLVWNSADMKTDWYFGGEKKAQIPFSSAPLAMDAVSSIMLGPQCYQSNKNAEYRYASGSQVSGVFVDELAFFNHSLSPEQVAWLGAHVPSLPPLDATNLVRTISSDCAWSGALAAWSVKEWDGEAWTATDRTTIYPALEDTEVETAVAFTSGATVTNDTFVTPKRLTVLDASGEGVSPTLVCADGSRFAPESMEIGDGVTLKVSAPFGNPVSAGPLTFGEGARIVFDCAALRESDSDKRTWKPVMTFGSAVLPEGETNILSHFGVSNGKYQLALSGDGTAILAKRSSGFIISVY